MTQKGESMRQTATIAQLTMLGLAPTNAPHASLLPFTEDERRRFVPIGPLQPSAEMPERQVARVLVPGGQTDGAPQRRSS